MLDMILLYREGGNIAAVALLRGATLAELELAEGWPVPIIDRSMPRNGYLDVITPDHTVTLPGWPAWGEVPQLFGQTLVVRGETPWPKLLLADTPPSPDLFWRAIGRPELRVRFHARPGSDPQYHILAVKAPGCEAVRITFRDGNMIDYPAGYGVAVCNLGAATPDGTPGGLHPLRQVKSVCVMIDGTAYPVAIDEEPCVSTRPPHVDPAKPPPAVPPTNWRPVAPWAASMHDAVTAESATVFHSTPPDAPSPYASAWQHDEQTGWPAGADTPKPPAAKPDRKSMSAKDILSLKGEVTLGTVAGPMTVRVDRSCGDVEFRCLTAPEPPELCRIQLGDDRREALLGYWLAFKDGKARLRMPPATYLQWTNIEVMTRRARGMVSLLEPPASFEL